MVDDGVLHKVSRGSILVMNGVANHGVALGQVTGVVLEPRRVVWPDPDGRVVVTHQLNAVGGKIAV